MLLLKKKRKKKSIIKNHLHFEETMFTSDVPLTVVKELPQICYENFNSIHFIDFLT